MEVKKSPKADLEGKKSTWLLVGYVVVLAFMFVAFEWTQRDVKIDTSQAVADVVFEEEIIPITETPEQATPPPPEAPKVAELLEIVDDQADIEESTTILNEDNTPKVEVKYVPVQVVEEEPEEENSAQFDVSDRRSLDEVVNWLLGLGYIPSFCTACYREGRTGDRFMKLLKSGQIVNCCQPNALMTLKEYLEDYASADTKEKGEKVIREQLEIITNPVVKEKAKEYIENIHEGKRDFRF